MDVAFNKRRLLLLVLLKRILKRKRTPSLLVRKIYQEKKEKR